ncbi:MAG TPA: hypothetical protein PLI43_07560 [Albidovulum sp.]|uniref:hypothetical protein n=1 Tax=Albidovulum sp. TaxID=1872424 RepID=UPI002BB7E4CA|nr:hypothetical protein [Albidovulum sp.]
MLAIVMALGVIGFVGVFVWGAVRTAGPVQTTGDGSVATATVSETLSVGRVDAQIYALGNRDVRLEIQFTLNADAIESTEVRPNVNFAMTQMHMDGFEPQLERVEAGVWRARFKLPMAGPWIASVGFGEEFAEVEFDAQ